MILLLYIDPGTGSMLFSLFIALAATLTFALRSLFLKLRFVLSGGRAKNADSKNIPFVIFSDHKRYWNVFHGLCDEFERHGVDITYYTASADDPVLSMPYKFVHAEFLGEKNKPYARMNLLHADIVVATTPGLDVYQWKRSRYVKCYVHIPHTVRSLCAYRMFGLDHYDAVLTTGEYQNQTGKEMEKMRPAIAKKEFVVVGSPTLDNILEQKRNVPKVAENQQKIVLVAPSWGKSGILTKYGEKFLQAVSKTPFKIVVRPHPQTVVSEKHILNPLVEKFTNVEWNFDNDNFSVLYKADILISDFSGTMYDFVFGFGKPIIYTDVELDTAPYDSAWAKDPLHEVRKLADFGVKISEKDFSKIGQVIFDTLQNQELQKNLQKAKEEFWQFEGESAKREFDYLMEKHKEISQKGENNANQRV